MDITNFDLKNVTEKDLKNFRKGMLNMEDSLKKWGVTGIKLIDLNPKVVKVEKKVDKEEEEDPKNKKKEAKEVPHIGFWIMQGTHTSVTGKKFSFQIVPEIGVYKENTQQQYKVILQYGKDGIIEHYPNTNPDLKAIITMYVYNTATTSKMTLAEIPTKKK